MKITLMYFATMFMVLTISSFSNACVDEAGLKENLKDDTSLAITVAIDSYLVHANSERSDRFYKFMCMKIFKATVLMEQSSKYGIDVDDYVINLAVSQLSSRDLRANESDGRRRTIALIQSDLENLYSDKCE